jgi:RimJ/RimL family protein N-acetyltransferase
LGTRALELLVARLFEEEGAERLEARTALDNRAMCRVLERRSFALLDFDFLHLKVFSDT